MMKALNYFLISTMVVLSMCSIAACSSDDNKGDEEENGIPTSIVGLTIDLKDEHNDPYAYGVSLTGTSERKCDVSDMTKGDSSYTYTVTGENTASLTVLGVQNLIASNKHYTYQWNMKLIYSSPKGGTFTGTYTKASTGFVTTISGHFTIK